MTNNKNIKTTQRRRMKTFIEMEDGSLIDYYIPPGHWEDEFGRHRDSSHDLADICKDVEKIRKKKAIGCVAKVWLETVSTKSSSRNENITVMVSVVKKTKHLTFKDGIVGRYFYGDDPDKIFNFNKKYLETFNLYYDMSKGKVLEANEKK